MNNPHHKWTNSLSVSATFKVVIKSCRKYIIISVKKIQGRFLFDTTSEFILISRSTWERLRKPDLVKNGLHYSVHLVMQFDYLVSWMAVFSFFEKSFSGTCYVTDSGPNVIGLDRIDVLDLFSMSFNTVFCTCSFPSFRDWQTILHILSKRSSMMFSRSILGVAPKSKSPSSWSRS